MRRYPDLTTRALRAAHIETTKLTVSCDCAVLAKAEDNRAAYIGLAVSPSRRLTAAAGSHGAPDAHRHRVEIRHRHVPRRHGDQRHARRRDTPRRGQARPLPHPIPEPPIQIDMNAISAHSLAQLLLAGPDIPVYAVGMTPAGDTVYPVTRVDGTVVTDFSSYDGDPAIALRIETKP